MTGNPIIDYIGGSARTTTAATTTVITITPPGNDLAIHVNWVGAAKSQTDGEVTTAQRIASFENTSGTMAQIGATTEVHDEDEDTNYLWTEEVTGNTILLRVTGDTDTIDWSAHAQVTYHVVDP